VPEAKDTRETGSDEMEAIGWRRPTPVCIWETERFSSSPSTTKVLEARIAPKEKEDERLPTGIIELRTGALAYRRNGFPIPGNSRHAFVDCLCSRRP